MKKPAYYARNPFDTHKNLPPAPARTVLKTQLHVLTTLVACIEHDVSFLHQQYKMPKTALEIHTLDGVYYANWRNFTVMHTIANSTEHPSIMIYDYAHPSLTSLVSGLVPILSARGYTQTAAPAPKTPLRQAEEAMEKLKVELDI